MLVLFTKVVVVQLLQTMDLSYYINYFLMLYILLPLCGNGYCLILTSNNFVVCNLLE
jgi:hypothetical protein